MIIDTGARLTGSSKILAVTTHGCGSTGHASVTRPTYRQAVLYAGNTPSRYRSGIARFLKLIVAPPRDNYMRAGRCPVVNAIFPGRVKTVFKFYRSLSTALIIPSGAAAVGLLPHPDSPGLEQPGVKHES